MREAFGSVGTLWSALAARRDLILDYLALRHQLGVLARSDRRFRPADRLLWLCLRRWWPRWKDALRLVQPATVARWHREGFRGWWRRRARRRPGRPRIDADLRALIRRMRAENVLWGAPRIHGELLKLGFTVSERTVSRYVANRPRARSQTWRTFFAIHFGDLVLRSPVTSCNAVIDDVVGDGHVHLFGCAPSSGEGLCASQQWPVARGSPSVQQPPPPSLRRRTHARSGKDPPLLSRRCDGPHRGPASGYGLTQARQETDMMASPGRDHRRSGFLCLCNQVVHGV